MDPTEILDFIVPLICLLFVCGYYLPYFNKKYNNSKKTKFKIGLLEIIQVFGAGVVGLLLYIPLVILIYIIFALSLNLNPTDAIIYQTQGNVFYYISPMITSISSFMTYLAGAYSNFFLNIILLIITPIIALITLRFFVGEFSKEPRDDFITYTQCIFIPSLAIIFFYLLALLLNAKYGIYFSSTNYSTILTGIAVLAIGYVLVKFYLRFSNFSIKIMNSKKLLMRQRVSPFVILIVLLIIYIYCYFGGAYGIYAQPYLTNMHITKTGFGADLYGNITFSNSTTSVVERASSQVYYNVSGKINFLRDGVNFTVFTVNTTPNLSMIKYGVLPLGYVIGHRNYTSEYNESNPAIPYGCSMAYGYCSNYPKYVILSQQNNFTNSNFTISMYSDSPELVKELFSVNAISNNNCELYNCTITFSIQNLTRGIPTSFYYYVDLPNNANITKVSFVNSTACRAVDNSNGTLNSYNCFDYGAYTYLMNSLSVYNAPYFIEANNQTQVWKKEWAVFGSANTLSSLAINLTITH